jgi:hypothetical protein
MRSASDSDSQWHLVEMEIGNFKNKGFRVFCEDGHSHLRMLCYFECWGIEVSICDQFEAITPA